MKVAGGLRRTAELREQGFQQQWCRASRYPPGAHAAAVGTSHRLCCGARARVAPRAHFAPFGRCVQTVSASQLTKRAARADPGAALLAAAQIAPAGHRLPRRRGLGGMCSPHATRARLRRHPSHAHEGCVEVRLGAESTHPARNAVFSSVSSRARWTAAHTRWAGPAPTGPPATARRRWLAARRCAGPLRPSPSVRSAGPAPSAA